MSINFSGGSISGNLVINGGGVYINGRRVDDSSGLKGDGKVVEQQRDLSDHFSRVQASGIDELNIVCGKSSHELKMNGESNIISQFETRVENGTLHIEPAADTILQPTKKVAVTLFMDDPLSSLKLAGNTAASVQGLDTSRLKLDLSGSSQAQVAGKAQSLDLDLSGSTNFNGAGLLADEARVDLSGASRATVRASKELEADTSGASHLDFYGSPSLDRSQSGASEVRNLDTGETFHPDRHGNGSVVINGGTYVGGNVIGGDFVGGNINIVGNSVRIG